MHEKLLSAMKMSRCPVPLAFLAFVVDYLRQRTGRLAEKPPHHIQAYGRVRIGKPIVARFGPLYGNGEVLVLP
jgi:hypothetical protein